MSPGIAKYPLEYSILSLPQVKNWLVWDKGESLYNK